jgi:DNA-binding GntR family transcriptional regulator
MALRNAATLPGSLLAAHRPAAGNASQSAAAYAELRHQIITLRLPPATSIDEAALQSELGLGRTPIREALQRLAHENLVVILPRRGTLVADLNLADLHKIFELRLELEPLAAGLAAQRASPDQIAALDDLFDLSEQGLDARRLIDIDHQAHQLIAAAARNEFLAESLDRFYSHVLRLWHLTLERVPRLGEAVAEHREITGAIRDRAPERAARLMRAHVAGFQDDVSQAQSGWPDQTPSRKIS